jgi:hypothetical protein
MHPQVQERSAEDELCEALLRMAGSESQIGLFRRELSGFSHRCRNMLNGLKMSLFLVRREAKCPLPSWWGEIEDEYRGIETLFDHLQSIYRPLTLTPVHAQLGSLVRDRQRVWLEWFGEAGRRLEIVPPGQEDAGELDPMCMASALDAFVRWRAGAMPQDQVARFSWTTCGGNQEAVWHESGSTGVCRNRPAPACTSRRAGPTATIASLALPLLARVITAHRGSVERSGAGNFEVKMRWPLNLQPSAST